MPSRYGQRILTPADALRICALKRQGVRVNQLAWLYGVSHSTISQITRGRLWREAGSPRPTLTPRQREIVALLSEGLTPAAVGRRLGIRQIQSHLEHIAARYGLDPDPERRWATQIVLEAYRRGELKGVKSGHPHETNHAGPTRL